MLDPDPVPVEAVPNESSTDSKESQRRAWDVLVLGLWSPAVLATIAVTGGVFVLQLLLSHGSPNTDADPVYRSLRGWVPAMNHGEWWRLATSQLLHFSWGHLRDNMVMLYLFGPLIEHTYGRRWFVVTYVCAAVAGLLMTIGVTHLWGSFAGASVAVFGMHGAVIAVAVTRIRQRGYWAYLVAACASVAIEWSPYSTANWHHNEVHLYGLLAGLVLGVGFEASRRLPGRALLGRTVTIAAVLAVAIGVATAGWPHVPAHYTINITH
jgi:membrane associated rhomboid family serine protease